MLGQYQYCVSFVEIYKYKTFINLNTHTKHLFTQALFVHKYSIKKMCVKKHIFNSTCFGFKLIFYSM